MLGICAGSAVSCYKELSALIADEQKAIEELNGASDADIEGIVAEMGI